MDMTSKIPTITEIRNADETNKWLLLWQGLSDTWNKLVEATDRLTEMNLDVQKHEQMLITGTNDQPSVMERIRNLEKLADVAKRVVNAVLIQTLIFLFTVIGMGLAFFLKVYPILTEIANKQP